VISSGPRRAGRSTSAAARLSPSRQSAGLLSWQVVATEDRWVALPAKHRLAERVAVTLGDLAGEPFIALPATAGPLRQFWLAAEERQVPPKIAAEAETAKETFEAVASGLGIALLARRPQGHPGVHRHLLPVRAG
jgi:DNA-binding transcriptional LysR family regulator